MGTRSNIGMVQENGTVKCVYCHWDGYPDNNGLLLVRHWKTKEKIEDMLDLGDMSSLGSELGHIHDFDKSNAPENEHFCTFYGRDRGESDVEAQIMTKEDFSKGFAGAEYVYLFEDGKWLYKNLYESNSWENLTDIINIKDIIE